MKMSYGFIGKSIANVSQEVVERVGRFHAMLDPVVGSNTTALIDALDSRGRLISYGMLRDENGHCCLQ